MQRAPAGAQPAGAAQQQEQQETQRAARAAALTSHPVAVFPGLRDDAAAAASPGSQSPRQRSLQQQASAAKKREREEEDGRAGGQQAPGVRRLTARWESIAVEEEEAASPTRSPLKENADLLLGARREAVARSFGTKPFLRARALAPAELERAVGAPPGSLTEEDCALRQWAAMEVVVEATTNVHCKNWVLQGSSSRLAVASSLHKLFVQGADMTVYSEDAHLVRASRGREKGIFVHLNNGGVSFKQPDDMLARELVSAINHHAAKRRALQEASDADSVALLVGTPP